MGVRSRPSARPSGGTQCLLFTETPTGKDERRGWRLRGPRTVREAGKQEAGPRAPGRCSGRGTLSPSGSPSGWGGGRGPTAALHLRVGVAFRDRTLRIPENGCGVPEAGGRRRADSALLTLQVLQSGDADGTWGVSIPTAGGRLGTVCVGNLLSQN